MHNMPYSQMKLIETISACGASPISVRELARKSGLGRSTCMLALKRLKAVGYISASRDKRGRGSLCKFKVLYS